LTPQKARGLPQPNELAAAVGCDCISALSYFINSATELVADVPGLQRDRVALQHEGDAAEIALAYASDTFFRIFSTFMMFSFSG
jgi:hypothetical protein